MTAPIKLIECPRDAMQGIHQFIPTDLKATYINLLLKVGFNTLDFGSFVSAKAIPQMKGTAELIKKLDFGESKTKLLAIIANTRGAEEACEFEEISYLGFPFSVSETFQQRNTNSSIQESLTKVEEIRNLCAKYNKEAVVYLSMGFGNPYGEVWNMEILYKWTEELVKKGIKILSLADTTGVSTPENISEIFPKLLKNYPQIEWGLHLHAAPQETEAKIAAAFNAGCKRIDSAIKGFGGCPMAADSLTGNIPTEKIIDYLDKHQIQNSINKINFEAAYQFSNQIFNA